MTAFYCYDHRDQLLTTIEAVNREAAEMLAAVIAPGVVHITTSRITYNLQIAA